MENAGENIIKLVFELWEIKKSNWCIKYAEESNKILLSEGFERFWIKNKQTVNTEK